MLEVFATRLVIFASGLLSGYDCAQLFNKWCDEHDYCYATPDADRESCDIAAWEFFNAACLEQFPKNPPFHLIRLYNELRPECFNAASTAYTGIR